MVRRWFLADDSGHEERPFTVDADGRFAVPLPAVPAHRVRLWTECTGRAEVGWSWHDVDRAADVDLGDIPLPPEASVQVDLRGLDGANVPGEWSTSARPHAAGGHGGLSHRVRHVRWTHETGPVTLDALLPGRYDVTARRQGALGEASAFVDLEPGESIALELHVEVRAITSTIEVELELEEHVHRVPTDARIELHALDTPDAPPRGPGLPSLAELQPLLQSGTDPQAIAAALAVLPRSDADATFAAVPPGRYRVTVDHPHFLPWSSEAVEPGIRVHARLVGAGSLLLAAHDRAGEPIAEPVLWLMGGIGDAEVPLQRKELGLLAAGLPLTPSRLIVSAPRHAPVTVEIDWPDDPTDLLLEVELPDESLLAGVVLDLAGAPCADAAVQLYHEVDPVELRTLDLFDPFSALDAAVTASTDASGRFEFGKLPAGSWSVLAFTSAGERAEPVQRVLAEGERGELVLVLSPPGDGDVPAR